MPGTQYDVARLAGVSRKTVSNVIHDHRYVTPEVRARVREAIAELDYQPNRTAQNLRTGRSNAIGLAVPELNNPYFGELARYVVESARLHGNTVLIDQTLGDRERERAVLEGFNGGPIDGLIYSPITADIDDIASRRRHLPIVILGEHISSPKFDHIVIDNVAASRVATEHLLELRRRHIGFVGAGRGQTADLRLSGYQQALQHAGIAFDQDLVEIVGGYDRYDGAVAMGHMLHRSSNLDAVVCANDLLAHGALRTLRESGCGVPEDVAVVGIDDIDESSYGNPTLTTIAPDKEQLAEAAVSRLLQLVESGIEKHQREPQMLIGFTLKIRESTIGPAGFLPLHA